MLKNKTILLGVSGSIAAYKAADLASMLKKAGADVHVFMTKNALHFINPITFETLTSNKCIIDTFDRDFSFDVKHISLAKRADLVAVAPASADVIGKLAAGIADDMLTTTVLACRCPLLLAPAMNTAMYEHPIVRDNMQKLQRFGWDIIEADSGRLACGDVGKGKFPPAERIFEEMEYLLTPKDMAGIRILVTAGPTQESIDPVRFITNHSSGKMGYAIARAAAFRGAEVTLISGPTSLNAPPHLTTVNVVSAADMAREVKARSDADIIIKAAAVADYTPITVCDEKIKKSGDGMDIALKRTEDILAFLGQNRRPEQVLCGFSMETENLLENSRRKLLSKHLDMIAANSLKVEGAGFGGDTNVVTIITENSAEELPLMSKASVAGAVIDKAVKLWKKKNLI